MVLLDECCQIFPEDLRDIVENLLFSFFDSNNILFRASFSVH